MRPESNIQQKSFWSWFPWIIFSLLLFTVLINVLMVWIAKVNFPGVAISDPYEVGLAYNKVISNAARQDAMGWQAAITVTNRVIELRFVKSDKTPLTDLAITGTIERPVGPPQRTDFNFEPTGGGYYRANVAVPNLGSWNFSLKATNIRDNQSYQVTHRLNIK